MLKILTWNTKSKYKIELGLLNDPHIPVEIIKITTKCL